MRGMGLEACGRPLALHVASDRDGVLRPGANVNPCPTDLADFARDSGSGARRIVF